MDILYLGSTQMKSIQGHLRHFPSFPIIAQRWADFIERATCQFEIRSMRSDVKRLLVLSVAKVYIFDIHGFVYGCTPSSLLGHLFGVNFTILQHFNFKQVFPSWA